MAQDNKLKRELKILYNDYKKMALPKAEYSLDLLEDVDIDLYEEDSYLAGLVETFLIKGNIGITEIQIDYSIDNRLDQAIENSLIRQEEYRKIIKYRKKMLELASALSRASGIPIRHNNAT